MKVFFIFHLLFLLVFLIPESRAQSDLQLSRTRAKPGETFYLTVGSNSTSFVANEPSSCPEKLQVNSSNIRFMQASGTFNDIEVSDVISQDGGFTAKISVPTYAPTGNYNLVVGNGEPCAINDYFAFRVGDPYVYTQPSFAYPGDTVDITIYSSEMSFDNNLPSSCPSLLHINSNGLLFTNGSQEFRSSEAIATGNNISAKVIIPRNAIGNYNLIIGEGEPCLINTSFPVFQRPLHVIPSTGLSGKTVTVQITAGQLSYTETGESDCINTLKVSASNIVFHAASSTTPDFTPSSITVIDNLITAVITLPDVNASDFFNITVGADETCPQTVSSGFSVEKPASSIYPVNYSLGQTQSFNISSNYVNFVSDSPSNCPDRLRVTSSAIVFKQGSSTSEIRSENLSVSENYIWGNIFVPDGTPTGHYDVVIGDGEACPLILKNAVQINPIIERSIDVFPSSAHVGEQLTVTVTGNEFNFAQASGTICPDLLNVTTSGIVFKQASGTAEFYPSMVLLTGLNTAELQINVPSSLPQGYYEVIVGTQTGCPVTKLQGFFVDGKVVPAKDRSIDVFPSSAHVGEQLTVTVTGNEFNFAQASGTICPDLLNVTTSGIVFKQASGTAEFYPSMVLLTGSNTAELQINVPSSLPQGYYDVIVGTQTGCPVTKLQGFFVDGEVVPLPTLNVLRSDLKAGQPGTVEIIGRNVRFDSSQTTQCPGLLNVTISNVALKQSSGTIVYLYPQAVQVSDSLISASFNVPESAAEGYYDIGVGVGEGCPLTQYGSIYIQGKSVVEPVIPSISVTPDSISKGTAFEVTIVGENVQFQHSGNSECPSVLTVTATDVVFRRANNSLSFSPSSVSLGGIDLLSTNVLVPSDMPTGYYDVIVGANSGCPISLYSGLFIADSVSAPSVNISPSFILSGDTVELEISGLNLTQTGEGVVLCDEKLLDVSSVVLKKGEIIIESTELKSVGANLLPVFYVPLDAKAGEYEVIVGYGQSCSYSSKIVVDSTIITSTIESKNKYLINAEIYPNPTDGSFIGLKQNSGKPIRVIVADQLGRELLNTEIQSSDTDLSSMLPAGLSSGLYLVRVVAGESSESLKLVVK